MIAWGPQRQWELVVAEGEQQKGPWKRNTFVMNVAFSVVVNVHEDHGFDILFSKAYTMYAILLLASVHPHQPFLYLTTVVAATCNVPNATVLVVLAQHSWCACE